MASATPDPTVLLGAMETYALVVDRSWHAVSATGRPPTAGLGAAPGDDLRPALALIGLDAASLASPAELPMRQELRAGPASWIELRAAPLPGRETGDTLLLLRDIAEEKREELRRAAEHGRTMAMLDAIGDAFYVVDRDWRLTYVNARIEQLWGKPREEIVGRRLAEVLPGYADSASYRQLGTALTDRRPLTFEAVSYATGNWIEVNCRPIGDGVLVHFHNIAARKRAEAALRESEDRLRVAVEATGLGTWDFDPASGRRTWSDTFRSLLGIPADAEATADAFLAAVHPQDRAYMSQAYNSAFDAAGDGYFATEFRRLDERWLAARGRVTFDAAGRPVRAIGTLVDITERRRAEEELRALTATLEERVAERTRQLMLEVRQRERAEEELRQALKIEAIGQLTGGVAHDFNNLLAAILGNLDLLADEVQSEDGARYLAGALRAGERGRNLTRQLLAFARKQHLVPRPTDLNQLVEGTKDMLTRVIGGTISIETTLTPDPWPSLVDPNQIELILLNLCINARDAMPNGGKLRIATRNLTVAAEEIADLAAGDYVRISVADTGIGMSADVLSRAIEPFFTTKQPGAGTGLGLSQAFGVARQLGGTVRLKSEPGSGTIAEVFLPRSSEPQPRDGEASVAERGQARGQTILVVDDDDDVREVMATTLRELDYRVVEAADGAAGLAVIAAPDTLDLLIVDYAMPGMTGAEMVRQARQIRPELQALYVTGYADRLPLPLGPRDALLGKPFRNAEMASRVTELLARRPAANA